MEERKLRVLEAYNAVTEQLATIKAKAETAALYNAQMKISENNLYYLPIPRTCAQNRRCY